MSTVESPNFPFFFLVGEEGGDAGGKAPKSGNLRAKGRSLRSHTSSSESA